MATSPSALLPLLVLAVICAVATAHVAAGEHADRRNVRVQVRGTSSTGTARRSLQSESTTGGRGNASTPLELGVEGVQGGNSTGGTVSPVASITDACASMDCGANGKCGKDDAGVATCSCATGFKKLSNGTCADKCALMDCGANGKCGKDDAGVATCSCATGFKKLSNGTCADECTWRKSEGKLKCEVMGAKTKYCGCRQGFEKCDYTACEESLCSNLGCASLGGRCVRSMIGLYSCQWASPCGNCPDFATCKSFMSEKYKATIQYCVCPYGYGMTENGCVMDYKHMMAAASFTFIQDPWANDKASRPFTVRASYGGCMQLPREVAGKYRARSSVFNIADGTPRCKAIKFYDGNNCEGNVVKGGDPTSPDFAFYAESKSGTDNSSLLSTIRSIWCETE
ncbi:unnamed protein product [Closterium sp. Yama58-4]|nr:unnamed protein product [Closterium sp. Yama58-4]